MVKAFGVGFLARPRSEGADRARESTRWMLAPAGVAAAACCLLAFAPGVMAGALTSVLHSVPSVAGQPVPRYGLLVRVPGTSSSLSPALLAVCLVVGALMVALATRVRRGATRRRREQAALWGCGGPELTPRMQYTSSSFAEPLQRVFDDVLRPDIDVEVSHLSESRYLVAKVRYRPSSPT